MDPVQIFVQYGPQYFPYLVFACAIVEDDVTFIMSGVYAASVRPHLNPFVAIAAGMLGALIRDSVWFALGHNRSTWLKKTTAWKRLGPQVESWAKRFGVKELFFCRFIPGTRNVSALFWGIQRLPWVTFLAVETLALSIWTTLLVTLGFKFGQTAESLLGRVKQKHIGRWLIMALLITVLVYLVIRIVTRHEIVKHGKPPEDPRAD